MAARLGGGVSGAGGVERGAIEVAVVTTVGRGSPVGGRERAREGVRNDGVEGTREGRRVGIYDT